MAQQHLDSLMKQALEVANDRWARSGIDKSAQRVVVTRYNIKAAFIESVDKYFASLNEDNPLTDQDFNDIASASLSGLKESLSRSRTSAIMEDESDSNKIVFHQSRTVRAPFRAIKKGGQEKLLEILKSYGKIKKQEKNLGQEFTQSLDLGLQRLHKDTTVGIARLKKVVDILEKDSEGLGRRFIQSKNFDSIFEKYKDLLADFELVNVGGKETIRYTGRVDILVQRKGRNFPGSEQSDWAKVSKLLEKELSAWLAKQDIARMPGSATIEDEATQDAEELVFATLTGKKALRTKRRQRKSSVSKQDTSRMKAKQVRPKRTIKNKKVSEAKRSMFSIIAMINQQLPRVIERNMREPALQNRTGTFANSVKIVEASTTTQGFPSLGYTYQRNPYEVFEVGRGRAPWATPERDPRRLIDASIREVAAQMALGRFYTRRV